MQEWLDSAGLSRLTEALKAHGIEREQLSELTDEDLRELGLTIGERKRFRRALAAEPPLAAERPAVAVTRAERRPLSIMFIDMIESTRLSDRLDGEDFLEVLRLFRNFCAGAIERYGGRIAQLTGDGILAYFCYPVAHEDDSARAIRAALDITAGIGALKTPADAPLQVRIGIAAGPVVVSSLHTSTNVDFPGVTGSIPNLAARLQTLARPDTVVISELMQERVASLFACEDLGPQHVKGFDVAQHVFRVLRPLPYPEIAVRSATRLTPLFGREAELSALDRRWAATELGQGSAVLIAGEAGIGKSRLVERFLGKLVASEAAIVRITSSPFDQDSPLRPFLAHFRVVAGLDAEDDPAIKLSKLGAVLHGPDRDADLPVLAELLSLPGDPSVSTLPPALLRQRGLDAICGQLLALAEDRPACILVEDLHWLDPTSRELLASLAERAVQVRMLLLMTMRDTATDAPPAACTEVLRLQRLAPDDVAGMVQCLFTEAPVPAAVVRGIVERSDGVPLFVEELLRPVLRMRAGLDWSLLPADDAGPGAVPTFLHETLMARLDRSGPAKEVAQVAAVIGRVARRDLLAEISGLDAQALETALEALNAAAVLHPQSHDGRDCYVFSHALVRDTAYDSLLRDERRMLHARTARALAALDPDGVELQPELLALHLTEGGLGDEAVEYWRRAGERSVHRSALLEASRLLRRGLGVARALPPTPANLERQLAMMALLGPVLISLYGPGSTDAQSLYAEAYALMQQTGNGPAELRTQFPLLWGWWRVSRDFRVMTDRSTALLSRAARRGELGLLLQAHHCNWASCYNAADFRGCQDHIACGMALYASGDYRDHAVLYGNHDAQVCAHGELAQVHWIQGRLRQALEQEDRSLQAARGLGHVGSFVHAMDMALLHRSYRRDHVGVAELANELLAFTADHGLADHRAKGLLFRGWATAMSGDAMRGMEAMAAGLARQREIGTLEDFPIYLSLYAEALIAAGRAEQAVEGLTRGRDEFESVGLQIWMPEVLRSLGQAMLAADPAAVAAPAAIFREASALARLQDAAMLDLRVAVSEAELSTRLGNLESAHVRLRAALAAVPEQVEDGTVQEARALVGKVGRQLGLCR
ncbi:MAG TPA: AAA family ATPase [Acetobacteraceae bacterium]|nr:AAA family ATPase [Acetobacteraceae bacterium]